LIARMFAAPLSVILGFTVMNLKNQGFDIFCGLNRLNDDLKEVLHSA